jgi:hypothetical protein
VCFRARLVDANRCDLPTNDTVWSVQRISGTAQGQADRNCFTSTRGSGEGEFELTATAGGFTARANVAIVTADQFRDLVAAHLEDPDAGAVETPSGSQIGTVSAPPPPPASSDLLPVALLAVALLLGGGGLILILRRRPKRAIGASNDSNDTKDEPAPRESMPATGRQRHKAVAIPLRQMPIGARPPQALAQPAPAPAPAPAPLVMAAPAVLRTCPVCGNSYGDEMLFCPRDGTRLAQDGATNTAPPAPAPPPPTSAPPPPAPPSAPAAPTPPSLAPAIATTPAAPPTEPPAPRASQAPVERPDDGICPTCGRRYPNPVTFCGEDGSVLVRKSG